MKPEGLALLHEVADVVAAALTEVSDWGPSGVRDGQYAADLVVDEAALAVLRRAGVGVLSEESGGEHLDRAQVVVIDPLDGSTNASRGIPWFATALCLVDADGLAAAVVANQASGVRYWAERGAGAWCDDGRGPRRLRASARTDLGGAIVGVSGPPPRNAGWAQFRALGALALDLCLVADGVLDGFMDCLPHQHGVWDYLGATLICREAGALVCDAYDRDLLALDHEARLTPLAAATPALLADLRQLRATLP